MSTAPETARPADEAALAALVAGAARERTPIETLGGGSKRGVGRAVEAGLVIETGGLAGITLHEPAELVVAARAGTPLSVVVEHLADKGQMLPFEPADYRALLGSGDAEPTVGGTVAANLSGPRRITAGACRDSLIGVRFVNGRGDIVKNGGRVMKNVTGYDLSKLMAGSWGTLGLLTEATFKVLPRPETEATLLFPGLADAEAVALMSAALGTPYEVSAAAHLPAGEAGPAQTALRLEHFARSVAYRADRLSKELRRFGSAALLDAEASARFWAGVRDIAPLVGAEGAVWRLSIAPSKAADAVASIRAEHPGAHLYDWGGGLVWLAVPESEAAGRHVRRVARQGGGHAELIRAGAGHRAAMGLFARAEGPAGALVERVRATFDPAGILNPGRMT